MPITKMARKTLTLSLLLGLLLGLTLSTASTFSLAQNSPANAPGGSATSPSTRTPLPSTKPSACPNIIEDWYDEVPAKFEKRADGNCYPRTCPPGTTWNGVSCAVNPPTVTSFLATAFNSVDCGNATCSWQGSGVIVLPDTQQSLTYSYLNQVLLGIVGPLDLNKHAAFNCAGGTFYTGSWLFKNLSTGQQAWFTLVNDMGC